MTTASPTPTGLSALHYKPHCDCLEAQLTADQALIQELGRALKDILRTRWELCACNDVGGDCALHRLLRKVAFDDYAKASAKAEARS